MVLIELVAQQGPEFETLDTLICRHLAEAIGFQRSGNELIA